MGGATGLDYSAVYPLIDRMTNSREEWDDLFEDIQALEGGALEEINRKRD